jgi:UDP-glucose 4-epimerase
MTLSYDRLLVTGGAGFIGSHTVDALLEQGSHVWVLDDLSSGLRGNLRRWKRARNLQFTQNTVAKYNLVVSLARKVDAILHFAAVVSPAVSMINPQITNEVNVSGTLSVLRAAQETRVHRVVFASSSSVYGKLPIVPTRETAVLDPITPYGASKLAGEKYCRAFFNAFELGAVALRYFNVYGSRQSSNPYSGVISIFLDRLRRRLRPLIYGTGKQIRDFVHVSDVVRANLLALESPRGSGETFNIGTGYATTINELARLLASTVNRNNLLPIHTKPRPGDPTRSCADISKARRVLRFTPAMDLKEGLVRLVNELSAEKG